VACPRISAGVPIAIASRPDLVSRSLSVRLSFGAARPQSSFGEFYAQKIAVACVRNLFPVQSSKGARAARRSRSTKQVVCARCQRTDLYRLPRAPARSFDRRRDIAGPRCCRRFRHRRDQGCSWPRPLVGARYAMEDAPAARAQAAPTSDGIRKPVAQRGERLSLSQFRARGSGCQPRDGRQRWVVALGDGPDARQLLRLVSQGLRSWNRWSFERFSASLMRSTSARTV